MGLEVLKFQRRSSVLVPGTLLTGSAYFFSTGLTGLRPLVWAAPLPVLILALNSSAPSEVLLVAEVQTGSGHTLYSVAGDWFAWLSLLLLSLALLSATAKSR